ncbi:hypothetical protein C2845_PM06G34630 [Panicum miliaceum]|uniref:Uncharacterized protein n=1 Tax=Panicum miliaceum TaxID=4540 RepID=A0A3L6REV6_PANMI|nr:hypothetical protein C2845_PM06G34630 [Panicum miliaceum]
MSSRTKFCSTSSASWRRRSPCGHACLPAVGATSGSRPGACALSPTRASSWGPWKSSATLWTVYCDTVEARLSIRASSGSPLSAGYVSLLIRTRLPLDAPCEHLVLACCKVPGSGPQPQSI